MQWGLIWSYRDALWRGLALTLELSAVSIIGSFVVGVGVGCLGATGGFLLPRLVRLYTELLRNLPLSQPVADIMTRDPRLAPVGSDDTGLFRMMRALQIRHLPLVDEDGRVVGLRTLEGLLQTPRRPNRVVLMAGGLGARLHPLTRTLPKPMLSVGGKPLLETILETFIDYGFWRFSISLNYLAEIIVGHFGDGVATVDGGNVYVPYTLGGETVEVATVHGHPDRRRLLAVERASPERIAPFCQHFGICGGCAIQHWDAENYRAWKRNLVVETLAHAKLACEVMLDAAFRG